MKTKNTLKDLYNFSGFRTLNQLKKHPEDTDARVITLRRRQKKTIVQVADKLSKHIMTTRRTAHEIYHQQTQEYMLSLNIVVLNALDVKP